MPSHPAVNAIWVPLKSALELITTGKSPADSEIRATDERIRQKIQMMLE
jgi:maltose-binding protein MalE